MVREADGTSAAAPARRKSGRDPENAAMEKISEAFESVPQESWGRMLVYSVLRWGRALGLRVTGLRQIEEEPRQEAGVSETRGDPT